ncbi:MAG TPA: hypothetical protein VFU19_15335 [Iamia sp.]|nr:hypothetical protein [Iamia sp.]
MDDPKRLSLQSALMAMSAWVLAALLLSAPYSVVGVGGIVVLLGTLVGVRVIAPRIDRD